MPGCGPQSVRGVREARGGGGVLRFLIGIKFQINVHGWRVGEQG